MTDPRQKPRPDLSLRGLSTIDGRSRPVQSFRRMREQLLADMGDDVPATRLATLDVLAMACAVAREEFHALLADPTRDPARFVGLGNLIVGASRTLGLRRVPKDVPTLKDYMEGVKKDA